ncbi:MAG: PAS domain-containing protein [Sulfuricella sp.]|nr:PAS domain-containing protein [Sulfuricella sp.]
MPIGLHLLMFALFAFFIGLLGYATFEQNRKSIAREKIQELGAIADLKAAQIAAWQEAHRRRAEYYMHGSLLAAEVDRWLKEGAPDNDRKENIRKVLAGIHLQELQGYKDVSVLDAKGNVRISTGDRGRPDAEDRKLAEEAMRGQQVLFLDIHRRGGSGPVELGFAAPLLVAGKGGERIVGAVLFTTDPDSFLYPLIQTWPTASPSAETVLVRRDGDSVLFLNELRHRKGPALSLRLPLATSKLPSAMWLRGEFNAVEGDDYRGVPVVTAVREIPGTPWAMVAKVDKAELFAGIDTLERWVAGLASAFAAFGGAVFFLWFSGSQARIAHLQVQRDAAEALRGAHDQLEAMFSNIHTMVVYLDADFNFIRVNQAYARACGYTPEFFVGKNHFDLYPHAENQAIFRKVVETGEPYVVFAKPFEFPDHPEWGITYWDWTLHPIKGKDGKVERLVFNLVDVTERKRGEIELERQRAFLRQVIDADPNYIFVKDANGRFLLVNQAMAALHGLAPQELIGLDGAGLFTSKEEAEPHLQADREVIATRRPFVFIAHNFLGGKERWLMVTKVPMEQHDGTVQVLGIAMDITERKQAEEKLRISNLELQRLATHLELVREEEQKRIARELHDEMGGVLAALNIKVSMLAVDIPAEMPQLLADVRNLEKLVADGIKAMRQTVAALRPSLLDEVGLKIAIEKYTREFEQNTGIECDLRLPEAEPAIGGAQAATIFRIVQESLTNVAKHAQASKVSITLSEWDGSLMLTVKDNGKGFDPSVRKAKSFGLLGIRERAAMVGGKAEISSAPGKGTTVRVSLARAE